ncbi:glycosyltransferase family 4 protein [Actinomyces oris]|uniref:Glycosyltransferase family 4 protein n=1 Tax=Actinomyces oris TaxID=544580 RepID=A0AAW9KUF7_9ACTO|nr:glycosyltransferase family 4 protein [Actinomyces oris]MEA1303870.1 glycosyltransferase family 4 protein [Actinomyces oris]OLO65394.1 glycosyltransferase WbuB [Actinomyces oris]
MRILLLTHYWAPEVGAPQRRWNRLAKALISRGHELAVLAPAPHYPGGRLLQGGQAHMPGSIRRDVTGAMVHRTIFRPYSSGVCARGVDQMVAAADSVRLGVGRFRGVNRPDVVLGSVPGLPTLPAALAVGRVLHRPVVVELRDAWPDLLLSAAQWSQSPDCPAAVAQARRARRFHVVGRGARCLLPPLITRLEREAAAVVTTTDSFAQVLRSRGVRRVVTVRNTGATVQAGRTGADRHRSDGVLKVLYLGTVGRAQGLGFAVRAAHIAQRNGTPVVLRIVGDGAQLQEVATLARRLGAPVEIHPAVPWTEVDQHYAWADTALVSLQNWPAMSVTVPSKLYEIMSAGVHVCASVDGEARRIVEDAGCGDVAAPQDPQALASLWCALAADRSRLDVAGGRRWLADHADAEAMTDRYESLLRQVAGD